MIKRVGLLFLSLLLVLTGCLGDDELEKEEKVVQEKGKKEEKAIITGEINTGEKYYRSIFPFEPGGARGVIRYGVDNRLDINEFEMGLMRVAQDTFNTDKYFFQEGQFLNEPTVTNWLRREDEKPGKSKSNLVQTGLNPKLGVEVSESDPDYVKKMQEANTNSPKYLSYVLEHNYLVQSGDGKVKLGGVVVGLSFNSTYYFDVKKDSLIYPGEVNLDREKVKKEAQKIAGEVASRLRQDSKLKDVPIVIALYQEEERDAVTPGNFFSAGVVKKGSNSVSSWEDIDEEYILFPSSTASKKVRSDYEKFTTFKTKVQEYFPNFIGVIGRGFYKEGNLERMTIEIPVQFRGKAEIISFTQFVATSALNELPNVPIEVYIGSAVDQPEALIVKDDTTQEEPFVHIYRK
ncbi:CamS family sex pheromone protein [Fictibacillus phosphorivorans]|uniref:CamS family sex pheromone protein n=1 Tax=Fictibacillus phosphorivorans TaxID=1221500 RepID=UPI00203CEA51|nr:CamS family sex pheromone protein [Fictibacillus phosphorivorans]MCM3720178.1 CamS family sex pheromone protein [Fictibacillus phosphorivorans]MCM3777868.1 CamS family sex pheromone protein [Fictibacillus phosphorivorans]